MARVQRKPRLPHPAGGVANYLQLAILLRARPGQSVLARVQFDRVGPEFGARVDLS